MSALTRNMIRCGVILLRIGEIVDMIAQLVQEHPVQVQYLVFQVSTLYFLRSKWAIKD